MDTTSWLASFVVFSLGVFHLSLVITFHSRTHLWLSLAWFGNCLYLYLEHRARLYGTSQVVPYTASSLLLLFFILAGHEVRKQSAHTTFAIAISVLSAALVPAFLLPSIVGPSFIWKTILGSILGCIVYIRLGRGFYKLDLTDMGRIFLHSGGLLYAQGDGLGYQKYHFLPVDATVMTLQTRAVQIDRK